MIDPIEEQIASVKAASDQNFSFYNDKLKGITNAYRTYMNKYGRDGLLNLITKALVESPNTREDLAYLLTVAIDQKARS